MIQTSSTVDNESDDELSTGAAVAITFIVTFIITLVVTAVTSILITSLYYKHSIDNRRESEINQEGDQHALTKDMKRHDLAYATTNTNVTMDSNPAYATTN